MSTHPSTRASAASPSTCERRASSITGADVGGTSAIIKVFYTELLAKLMREVTDLQGVTAQVDQPLLECAGWETGFWMIDYVHSFGWAIGGGTSEIMRNVIGERMLGLPR